MMINLYRFDHNLEISEKGECDCGQAPLSLSSQSGIGGRLFADQVDQLKVQAHCECGCASIDFSPLKEDKATGLMILSDHVWTNSNGGLSGIFLFAKGVNLAGLEVWSVDGSEPPTALPEPESLQEFQGKG